MSNTKRDVIFFTGVALICCFTSTLTAASWPVHGQNDSSISLRDDNAIAPFSIKFDDFHFRGKRSPLRPLVQKVAASNKIKQVLKWGAGKIFPGFIGNFIKVMLDLFWPTNEPSVWDEAKDNFR